MPHQLALLVNPAAGRGAGLRLGHEAARLLRRGGYEVVECSGASSGQAGAAASVALSNGCDTLVVVGGDGTVNLGANLCAATDTRLAVVAAGAGNDIALHLGLPVRNAAAAVSVIEAGGSRSIDAGRVTRGGQPPRWFAGVLGAGFDAVVAARAARLRWPRGPLRYPMAMLRELPGFRPIPYSIELDGRRVQTRAMLVAVANTSSFGGGMRVCPDAQVDDGFFDVLVVHALSTTAFLRIFPQVYSGRHVGHPEVEIYRARHVRLDAPGILAQADGEPVGTLPLEIELIPGALTVAVPDPGVNR